MNRREKSAFVEGFSEAFKASESSFVIKVGKLSVLQIQNLRSKLRSEGASLKIGKVRLMKIAVNNSGSNNDDLTKTFGGQIGVVFSSKQSQSVAKSLLEFGTENEAMELVSGIFKKQFMDKSEVHRLASIPPFNVLVARLARALNSPIARLARSLNEVSNGLNKS